MDPALVHAAPTRVARSLCSWDRPRPRPRRSRSRPYGPPAPRGEPDVLARASSLPDSCLPSRPCSIHLPLLLPRSVLPTSSTPATSVPLCGFELCADIELCVDEPPFVKQQADDTLKAYDAIVCFKCFNCFQGMLQVLYIDVAKVDRDIAHFVMAIHVCFKCMFQMFHFF